MSAETSFFSYSRTDSVFVLKLAKDLRDAGADLWLDQLDIKPGSHWDSSIETALNSAQRIIVVLSETSVVSNNVLDEISFALNDGKTIIPVVINKCKIPLRLTRLQQIDFIGDYQTGLNHLLEALGKINAGTVKQQQTKEIVGKNPDVLVKDEELGFIKKVKKQISKKYLFIIAGVLVLFLAIWGITQFSGRSNNITGTQKPNYGDRYKGGIIFYIDSSGQHGLMAGKKDLEGSFEWKEAIQKCVALGDGWRLPTKDELNMLYVAKDKVGGFSSFNYWSSSEFDLNLAWSQSFSLGSQNYNYKSFTFYVRAVRAF